MTSLQAVESSNVLHAAFASIAHIEQVRAQYSRYLKGQCHEIFCARLFHWTAPSGPIRATRIFLPFHWVISILKWLSGACDTGESLRNTQVEKKISTLTNGTTRSCLVRKKPTSKISWHCPFKGTVARDFRSPCLFFYAFFKTSIAFIMYAICCEKLVFSSNIKLLSSLCQKKTCCWWFSFNLSQNLTTFEFKLL